MQLSGAAMQAASIKELCRVPEGRQQKECLSNQCHAKFYACSFLCCGKIRHMSCHGGRTNQEKVCFTTRNESVTCHKLCDENADLFDD